jgi:PD-(D/E)XK nuclease superfamily protein
MGRAKGASRGRIPASKRSPAYNPVKQGERGEVAFLHKATSLGFELSLPYGHAHRYDFIVQSGSNLRRVQVKTTAYKSRGFYRVTVCRRANRKAYTYTESEIDFVAVYIIPEASWYILPVREVERHKMLSLRPNGQPGLDLYAYYREAWHLLREPDGLIFG